jgi:hypothetical protein
MLNEEGRAAAKARAQAAMDAASADLARGAIDEAEWQRRTSAARIRRESAAPTRGPYRGCAWR